jgi:tol-pal system protein YbgF
MTATTVLRTGAFRATALIGAVAFFGGCSSSTQLDSIEAQLADVQRQVLQLQQDGASASAVEASREELSRQLGVLVRGQADGRQDLSALEGQLEKLEAAIESLSFRLSQLAQQLDATSQQLKDARIAPVAVTDIGLDPQALYRAAYDDYLRGNFDLAILAFGQYLEQHPQTDLADNAAYWIGEAYLRRGRSRDAITAFDRVLTDYPRSDKTASALLKKAYALLEVGERAQAMVHLQSVVRDHPTTDEASLARQRLANLGG